MSRRAGGFARFLTCCIVVGGLPLGGVLAESGPGAARSEVDFLDPPQGLFLEDWMNVELSDQKIGYGHSTYTREGDVIHSRMVMVMRMKRADHSVDINMMQVAHETVSGEPLRFESVMKLATMEQAMRGVIKDGRVKVTSSQFGIDSKQEHEFPEGAKMLWGLFRVGIEKGFAPGTTYEVGVYEPSLRTDAAVLAEVSIGEKTTIDTPEGQREAIKVVTTMKLPMGSFDNVGYVDETGHVLRSEIMMAGMNMRMTATTKESALRDFDPPEFFMDTLVPVDRAIDRDTARRIAYTLRVTHEGQTLPKLQANAMQQPGEQSETMAKVTVTRVDHERLRGLESAGSVEGMEEYLRAGPAINIEDEAIIAMAKEAVGDAEQVYLKADKLRVYVSREIKEKNLTIGFATASEVCRNREGDCSEHAVLLAALGRVVGIPSRVVVGLAYVPYFAGKKNVFGFHMWTQFYIDGQWVDFDAALRESDCSPARIALATSALNDAGLGDVAFAIIDVITGLEITIDEIESR